MATRVTGVDFDGDFQNKSYSPGFNKYCSCRYCGFFTLL